MHDGYRLMARRDPVGIRLLTRRGNDWTTRITLVVEAVNHLSVRSYLVDGEAVCCDERGHERSRSIRPQRVPRLMRLYFRVGGTVAFGGGGSATTTRMRGDMTGGLCGT